jgi:hypothetical protein
MRQLKFVVLVLLINSDPLYVVDGVPFVGNLSSINFSDIASTTVLKMLRPLFMVLRRCKWILITTKVRLVHIQVETKLGYNVALLPEIQYGKISISILLGWEGLYNQGVITKGSNRLC